MNEFTDLDLCAKSLGAQRGVMECLARNVAAASVAGSGGYTRFVPAVVEGENGPALSVHQEHRDAQGTMTEMLAVMEAQRAYEGGASIFSVQKRMIERTLDIERT